jgi:hypothetical protein
MLDEQVQEIVNAGRAYERVFLERQGHARDAFAAAARKDTAEHRRCAGEYQSLALGLNRARDVFYRAVEGAGRVAVRIDGVLYVLGEGRQVWRYDLVDTPELAS